MSQYIVSARKYRPDNFETLIGQDNIATTLKNSILRGQLAHAYLFCGPRGVGKTTTARIFAKMINCSSPKEDMEPCGECESCRSFAEGRSYCIHELDAASNNGVDDIKALIDQVRVAPQVGKYSVYIIDEVHMLSSQAFNAFLKTLEEPPAHAIFILATTEKHKILPTILSRCQTYDFNRITVDNIVKNLRMIAGKEDITVDDESLHIIAQKADGAMRDALTIFDQTVAFCGREVKYEDVLKNLNVLSYEHTFELVEDFLRGDFAAAMLKFDEILGKGFNALHFVAALSSHLRDLVVSKSAGLEALLELPDSLKKRYKEQADRCPMKFLYDALAITAQCESGYRTSVNPRLHIEFALMKLCFIMNSPAPISVRPAAPETVAQTVKAEAPKAQAAPQAQTVRVEQPQVRTAPVPEAKPAVETKPAAEPKPEPVAQKPAEKAAEEGAAPVRRARRSAPGISVKGILSEGDNGTLSEVSERTTEPTEEEIEEKWKECAVFYASKPRLASMIATSKLTVTKEGNVIVLTFMVLNDSQVAWVQGNVLAPLEGKMQQLLGWKRLKLCVEKTDTGDTQKEAYTPDEKYAVIAQSNPEVRNLVDDFGGVLK